MDIWTINAGNVSGGPDGQKLVGCHITQNMTFVSFTKPNINDVLVTVEPSSPNQVFTFGFTYKDINWSVICQPLEPGQSVSATWTVPANPVKRTGEQTGTFTATADGTYDDADPAASSAKA